MTVVKKVWVGFGVVLALVGVLVLLNFWSFRDLETTTRQMIDSQLQALSESQKADLAFERTIRSATTFLMDRDDQSVADLNQAAGFAASRLRRIDELIGEGELRVQVQRLVAKVDDYVASFGHLRGLMEKRGLSHNLGLEGKLRAAVHKVEKHADELGQAELSVKMLMVRRHEKDYLLRGDLKYADRIDARIAEFKEIASASNVSEELRATYDKLWFEYRTAFRDLVAGETAIREQRQRFETLASEMMVENRKLAVRIQNRIDQARETLDAHVARSRLILGVVGGFSLIFGIGMAFWIGKSTALCLREIGLRMLDTANGLRAASNQIIISGRSVSDGAMRQATSIEQTGESLREISEQARSNAADSQSAKSVAEKTRAAVEMAVEDMRTMTNTMNGIKSSSDGVAKIMKTIDEISFQTNLLALNAAVEAARAGEAGLGFAVVAEEVRSLAKRSATAAKESATLINEAIDRSQAGVDVTAQVGNSLGQIVDRVRDMDQLVAGIANSSSQQQIGVDQITTVVSQLDAITQETASRSVEYMQASESLERFAVEQTDYVGDLVGMVGDVNSTSPGPSAETVAEPKRKQRGIVSPPSNEPPTKPVKSTANEAKPELVTW